jgi:pimeloyl-ACP methyl ester carboxylesterase
VRATLDLTPAYGQESITVRPKPVVLVHGLNADASTWAAYPGFLASTPIGRALRSAMARPRA